jgi:predicted MFS family arabinose efflux permease
MSELARRRDGRWLLLGVGVATAAAHIGNNFTTYLIGGLMDRYGFTPIQMGAWNMVETLSYAAAMFLIAPRVETLSPRRLLLAATLLIVVAQVGSATGGAYWPLLASRIATGLGFGVANTAVNLAAGRTAHPARAISVGIAVQTLLYAALNIGLPILGARLGVASMFLGLGALSLVLGAGAALLPAEPARTSARPLDGPRATISPAGARVLLAMALFTFGSLAIWPFIERTAHAIGLPATEFGRYQSLATLASAFSNLVLAAWATRLRRTWPLALALTACGGACAVLTTAGAPLAFAAGLLVYNASWFITYPLMLGVAYTVDPTNRLAVLCTAVWLAMTSLGSLATGAIAQLFGGFTPVGPMGLAFCMAAAVVILPLARRLDAEAAAPSGLAPAPAS